MNSTFLFKFEKRNSCRWVLPLLIFCFLMPALSINLMADADSIREFLAGTADTMYLQVDGNELQFVESDLQGGIVFQKMMGGIPLHGGLINVIRDSNDQIIEVIDDSSEHLTLDERRPQIAVKEAEKVVHQSMTNLVPIKSACKLVWFRKDAAATLAWEVTTQVADTGNAGSPTGLITVVDGQHANVLSQNQFDNTDYYAVNFLGVKGILPRIVINNSIGPAGSRDYAQQFESNVLVDNSCTGVLVAENVVLCARHCGVGAGRPVVFGANSNNGVFSTTVQQSILPAGGGSLLDGGDVAILRLNDSVPANVATPMRLVDATNNLVGEVCAMAGYGFNGVGSSGHGFSGDGFR